MPTDTAAHPRESGYLDVTVADFAEPALDHARASLGDRADEVSWQVADATRMELAGPVDRCHDHAMFHLPTDPADQPTYAVPRRPISEGPR